MKRRAFVPLGRMIEHANATAHPERFIVRAPVRLFDDYEVIDMLSATVAAQAVARGAQPLTKWRTS